MCRSPEISSIDSAFSILVQLSSLFNYFVPSFDRRNKVIVDRLSRRSSDSKELNFPTKYSQSYVDQFIACLWKQNLSYWRNPQYTAVRFFYTVIISLMFGTICWRFGSKRFSFKALVSLFFLHTKTVKKRMVKKHNNLLIFGLH